MPMYGTDAAQIWLQYFVCELCCSFGHECETSMLPLLMYHNIIQESTVYTTERVTDLSPTHNNGCKKTNHPKIQGDEEI